MKARILNDHPAYQCKIACIDVLQVQAQALTTACEHLRRTAYDKHGLSVDEVLSLRQLMTTIDKLQQCSEYPESSLTVEKEAVTLLMEAVATYVMDWDIDTYQPPMMRDQLTVLKDLSENLRQCVMVINEPETETQSPEPVW